MKEKVLILAGGLATRLGSLSANRPKSLVPILNMPFLHLQLNQLSRFGVKNVVLALGHYANQIEQYLKENPYPKLSIEISKETSPLGTAGAIKNALSLLTDTFMVLYGDSFLLYDFQKVLNHFNQQDKKAMITVYENKHQHHPSNVYFNHQTLIDYRKSGDLSKMSHIEYGISVFNKTIFDDCDESDLADFLQQLLMKKQLSAMEVDKPFYEVGSLAGIKRLEAYLTKERASIR